MNSPLHRAKILSFLNPESKTGNSIHSLMEGEFEVSIFDLKKLEDIATLIEKIQPQLILLECLSSAGNLQDLLESFQEFSNLPLILLVEEELEDQAMELVGERVKDYLFPDRLKRLPLAVRRILDQTEEKEKSVTPATNGLDHSRLTRLLESSADAIVILQPNGQCTYASPSIKKVLGFSQDEARELAFYSLVHLEDRHIVEEALFACLEMPGRPVQGLPIRTNMKDQETTWIETTFTNLIFEPEIGGIVVNFRDLTRYRDAEMFAKESQEMYRSFFENSPDGILITITGGEILAANPAACRMFGMSEKEICASDQTELMDVTDPRLFAAIKEREQKGKVQANITFLRKNGSRFEGEINSAAFRNAKDEERSSIIIRDITEKKEAKEELEKSEDNYRNLFQYNPLPSLIFDRQTLEILEVNKGVNELYGYSREELLEMRIPDLRPEGDRVKFYRKIRKERIEDGGVITGVVEHKTKSNELIKVDIHTHRIEFQKKNCRVVVLNDVTEKEAIFAELQEKKDKLSAAQAVAKLGYWEFDLQKGTLFWSDQVYKIWEKDKEHFTPTIEAFMESVHPDFRELFSEAMEFQVSDEIEHDAEYQILLESGSRKWIRGKGSLKRGKNGQPVSFGGTLQDITEQKQAQEKLRQNEARQRGILMSQSNYLIRTDLSGHYTYCNEKFRKDFSWIFDGKGFIGSYALLSVKAYHWEKVEQVFKKCLEHPDEVFQVEIDKLNAAAGEKTTLWDMICLTDESGGPVEIQAVGIDITERVQAEKQLRESNSRYEIISKATSDAIYDWDCRTGRMEWSEGYKKLFGHDLQSNINNWTENVHPEDKEDVKGSLKKVLNGVEKFWNSEYRFRKADGNYAVVLEQGSILRDEQQVALRMVGAIKDITEKKKSEQELKKKEANLLAAQKLAGFGYWEWDLNDHSIYWSEYAFKVGDRDLAEGHPTFEEVFDSVHPEDKEKVRHELEAALESDMEHNIEHRILVGNSKIKWVHQRGKVIYDSAGNPLRMEGTVQDITERKLSDLQLLRLNEELQTYTQELIAANKGLEQFSYIVSHNLRSPVANIKGLSDLIQNDDYDGEVKSQLLSKLHSSVESLDNVIIDLNKTLQLKKKISETKEPVHFEEVVNSIKSSISDQVNKEQVKIFTDFHEVGQINTVMSYIHSIFYNLITNSIKYRRENVPPEIKIISRKNKDKITISFEDNGLGIDLAKKGDQIFGLYKRFHHHVEGKGVGLFMVRTQVETLGGKISVFSEPGKGTQFILEFLNPTLVKENVV